MARLVIGIVLILFFVAGLFGEPPSMPAYLAGGSALFLLPGVVLVAFGVRRIRRGAQTPQPTVAAPPTAPVPVSPPPGAQIAPRAVQPGWHVDPTARHQHRFWDGAHWTRHVADDGSPSLEPRDVHELIRVLRDGGDVPAQVEAARMLADLHDTRAVQPLVEVAVARTHPPEVKEAALAALETIGDPSAAAPLVASAVSGTTLPCDAVGHALATIGDAADLAPLLVKAMSSNVEYSDWRDNTAECFIPSDRETEDRTSDECAFILGSAGDKGAHALLAAVALGSPRPAVTLALGRMPDPPVDRLVSLAHATDGLVRRAAVEALGEAAGRGGPHRGRMIGVLHDATKDDDEGVREAARWKLETVESLEPQDEAPSPGSLVSDEHEVRKVAITALRTSGVRDPEESRTVQDLTDPSALDTAALERELRDHSDLDIAYIRAAYPTGFSEDHAHADLATLRKGVAVCRRKGYLLARLSSYSMWQGDPMAALDHAVAAVLVGDPSRGPGDMVQVLELLTVAFRKTDHLPEAMTAARVQASFTLGAAEAAAVEQAAAELADRYPDEVGWAAGTVRGRLSAVLTEQRRTA